MSNVVIFDYVGNFFFWLDEKSYEHGFLETNTLNNSKFLIPQLRNHRSIQMPSKRINSIHFRNVVFRNLLWRLQDPISMWTKILTTLQLLAVTQLSAIIRQTQTMRWLVKYVSLHRQKSCWNEANHCSRSWRDQHCREEILMATRARLLFFTMRWIVQLHLLGTPLTKVERYHILGHVRHQIKLSQQMSKQHTVRWPGQCLWKINDL